LKSLFPQPDKLYLDVRSPKEYEHAHIPGALSLPLFTDDERALIGTIYKQKGQREAIHKGVEVVGPKLPELLFHFEEARRRFPEKKSQLLYCWRGGMRSGFMHAFFSSIGFQVEKLDGGYKAFRKKVLEYFEQPFRIALIGGFTGSGKTELLHVLKKTRQVLDLEDLASHRGSVFGAIPDKTQPSSEHFENLIAFHLAEKNVSEVIWMEDESRLIGSCCCPAGLFTTMKKAPIYVIDRPLEERIERVHALYGMLTKSYWVDACQKIARRLGGAVLKEVLGFVDKGQLRDAIRLLFEYYDRAYAFSLKKHQGPVHFLDTKQDTLEQIADKLKDRKFNPS
jgi:tRNA 2-selenouridine synthase